MLHPREKSFRQGRLDHYAQQDQRVVCGKTCDVGPKASLSFYAIGFPGQESFINIEESSTCHAVSRDAQRVLLIFVLCLCPNSYRIIR